MEETARTGPEGTLCREATSILGSYKQARNGKFPTVGAVRVTSGDTARERATAGASHAIGTLATIH